MSVVMIGLDHRSISLEALGRLSINADDLPDVLSRLRKSEHITEAVVLSTCLRTEFYFEAVRFHGAIGDACELMAEIADMNKQELSAVIFELHDEAAYAHLFRVTTGLESAVLGEPEVLGQVARAWQISRDSDACKAILNTLFRRAIEVGKKARTDTAIARGTTSIGQAAVTMAVSNIGDLQSKNVLLIGAGDMGDSMAVALTDPKHRSNVYVANRTEQRAIDLAERINGKAVSFDRISELLPDIDLVFTSTGSNEPIISIDMVESAMNERTDRPLVFVDVAVPADVHSQVKSVDDVTVLDMDDLKLFTRAGRADRQSQVSLVEDLIEQEVRRYINDVNARSVVPVVAALRDHAEQVRIAELERQKHHLSELSERDRALVESVTSSIMGKFLHEPTVRLKEHAGLPEGERMAEALRRLFDI